VGDKRTAEAAEAIQKVLGAIRCTNRPASPEEAGVDHDLLMDLYLAGLLWACRRGEIIVFGVTPKGRALSASRAPV